MLRRRQQAISFFFVRTLWRSQPLPPYPVHIPAFFRQCRPSPPLPPRPMLTAHLRSRAPNRPRIPVSLCPGPCPSPANTLPASPPRVRQNVDPFDVATALSPQHSGVNELTGTGTPAQNPPFQLLPSRSLRHPSPTMAQSSPCRPTSLPRLRTATASSLVSTRCSST